MTGKCYYLTTLADWQRHAAGFANSHWVALDNSEQPRILVLIEADEGVHLSLGDDPAFEPHPLAQKPISEATQSALAPHGVAPGATTFDAAEALARVHPLLRHRIF